jgi:hypothetical protein
LRHIEILGAVLVGQQDIASNRQVAANAVVALSRKVSRAENIAMKLTSIAAAFSPNGRASIEIDSGNARVGGGGAVSLDAVPVRASSAHAIAVR